jgi:hypothetical protein
MFQACDSRTRAGQAGIMVKEGLRDVRERSKTRESKVNPMVVLLERRSKRHFFKNPRLPFPVIVGAMRGRRMAFRGRRSD